MGELKSCHFCGAWLRNAINEPHACKDPMQKGCIAEGCDRCIPAPLRYCIDCMDELELQRRQQAGRSKP